MSTVEIKSVDELYEDLAETKLRIALTRIVTEDAARIQEEIDDDSETNRIADEMYLHTKDRMHRIFDRQLRKKRLEHMVKYTVPKVAVVAAAVLLVFYLGLSTAIAVSSTVRVKVMELIIRIEERYTELSIEENTEASFDIPADWLASYYPTYIPEGYELIEVFGTEENSSTEFQTEEGKRIVFTENDDNGMTNIDTENAKIGREIVNGKPVMTVKKNGISTLIWSDFNRYYTLWIDGDLDMAIQIVEGLRRIN